MAKKLTRYILIALVLGIIAGWAINAAIDDGTPASAARLKSIADYLSIVTALFLRLIKMIIAPLVFSTLVAGIAHMGDVAALGRVGVRSILWFILASLVSLTLGLILVTLLHPGVGLNLPHPAGHRRERRRDQRLQPQGLRHPPRAAVDLRGDEHQRNPADRRSSRCSSGSRSPRSATKGKPIVRGVEALVRVMLQVTDYVMRFAPFAVFTAVASALAERGPQIIAHLRQVRRQLLSRPHRSCGRC